MLVWSLSKKQLRLDFLNLRLPLLLVLSLTLTSFVAVICCRHFRKRVDDYHARCEYHKTSGDPIYIHRPPQALSIFCNGVVLKAPISVAIRKSTGLGQSPVKIIERPTDNMLFAQVQYPDIAFVVAIIVGLGAILLGYDSVCGEKERGTLKLALSNMIPRYKFLFGKLLGNSVGILIVVFLAWVVATVIVVAEPSIALSANDFGFIALSCLASFVYAILCIAIVLLISSMFVSPRLSLITAIAFWVMAVQLLPLLGPVIAKMLHKAPLHQQFISAKQTLLTDFLNNLNEEWKKQGSKATTYGQAMKIFNQVVWDKGKAQWPMEYETLYADYQAKVMKQTDITGLLCEISPPVSFQFAVSSLCGTSLVSQRHFERRAVDIARTRISGSAAEANSTLNLLHKIELPAKDRLKNCFAYLAYMLILAVFSYAMAFVRFSRYDIR